MRNSGSLNHRIEFYNRGVGKNEWGQNTSDPILKLACWAELNTQKTRDFEASFGTALQGSVTFIIRQQLIDKIDLTMKLKHKNLWYEIIRINPDVSSNRWCYIQAVHKS